MQWPWRRSQPVEATSSGEGSAEQCVRHVQEVLTGVDTVRYLAQAVRDLGRDFTERNVKCMRSPAGSSGPLQAGYVWADGANAARGDIVLYHDLLQSRDDVERALRHELVHAYDDTRGHVEPTNCYHHACSEVRAARLSGDCLVQQEARRGNVGNLVSGGRDCVLRRAALAVEQNPMCKGFGGRAVDVVFGRCYVDYEPFVAPIYTMGSVRSEAPAA